MALKSRTSRKNMAISPLIATLILIAVTIVGGIVVYRLFLTSSGAISQNIHCTIGDVALSESTLTISVKNDGTFAWKLNDVQINSVSLSPTESVDIFPGRAASFVGDVLAGIVVLAGQPFTVSATVVAYDTTGNLLGTYVTTATVFATPG